MCDGFSEALLFAAIVATAAGGTYSAYSSHQQGKAQQTQAKAEAEEMNRQAKLSEERAAIAQLQGEQEAEKRSRALAADIGSTYANWAGNGLLVDGAGNTKDSLTAVVNTQTAEAQADISNIRDNTAINIWEHQSNAEAYRASALNRQVYGKNMKRAGTNAAIATGIQTAGSVMSMGAKGAKDYKWGSKDYNGIFKFGGAQ